MLKLSSAQKKAIALLTRNTIENDLEGLADVVELDGFKRGEIGFTTLSALKVKGLIKRFDHHQEYISIEFIPSVVEEANV